MRTYKIFLKQEDLPPHHLCIVLEYQKERFMLNCWVSCGWTKWWLHCMYLCTDFLLVLRKQQVSWLQIMEETPNLLNSGRHQRDRAPFMLKHKTMPYKLIMQRQCGWNILDLYLTHLRDRLEYAAVAKNKTRNRKNRGVGTLLAAQGAERLVRWQWDPIFGNLMKMSQTYVRLKSWTTKTFLLFHSLTQNTWTLEHTSLFRILQNHGLTMS